MDSIKKIQRRSRERRTGSNYRDYVGCLLSVKLWVLWRVGVGTWEHGTKMAGMGTGWIEKKSDRLANNVSLNWGVMESTCMNRRCRGGVLQNMVECT